MDESKAGRSRRRRGGTGPGLESLEGRRLLAAGVAHVGIQEQTSSEGDVGLFITGTSKADVMTVDDNGTGSAGNITVTLGDGSVYTSKGAISLIEIAGKAGNDKVTYNLDGPLVAPRTVLFDGGAGNDSFADHINAAVNTAGELDVEAYGDAGNDTLSSTQPGAILAGQFVSYLEGGSGNDTLSYLGTGAVAAGASVSPEMSGGDGNDVINSNDTGLIDGNFIYNLAIDGGTGNDTIVDDVNAVAGSSGTIGTSAATPAAIVGGAGNDNITFAIHVDPAATATVNAIVGGGTGKDVIHRTSNVLGDKSNEKDLVIA